MNDEKLMQQALEALEDVDAVPYERVHAIVEALRERLRQPSACDGCAICNSDDYVPISADGRSVFIDGVGMVPLAFGHKPSAEPVCVQGKLWLWRNHVDGRPEYWAFENPFPVHENGDPQTLGEPCGYALLKPSHNGRPDVGDEVVIRKIKPPTRTPLTDEEINDEMDRLLLSPVEQEAFGSGVRYAERKHGIGEKS